MLITFAVVDSIIVVVAFFQSERCNFVIQYSNGVMKKFHGSRVAMLKIRSQLVSRKLDSNKFSVEIYSTGQ